MMQLSLDSFYPYFKNNINNRKNIANP